MVTVFQVVQISASRRQSCTINDAFDVILYQNMTDSLWRDEEVYRPLSAHLTCAMCEQSSLTGYVTRITFT